MNGFLIDTNVLSEYNRPGGTPDTGVPRWLETAHRDLQFVSVITLAEIQKGIGLLDEGKRRSHLQEWLDTELEEWFSGRILPIDRQVAKRWASIWSTVRARADRFRALIRCLRQLLWSMA